VATGTGNIRDVPTCILSARDPSHFNKDWRPTQEESLTFLIPRINNQMLHCKPTNAHASLKSQ
jgi:hypothetical protein